MTHHMKRIDPERYTETLERMKSGVVLQVNGAPAEFEIKRSNPIWPVYWRSTVYPWRREGRALSNRFYLETKAPPPIGSVVTMMYATEMG